VEDEKGTLLGRTGEGITYEALDVVNKLLVTSKYFIEEF
jgi:hypothetical protein